MYFGSLIVRNQHSFNNLVAAIIDFYAHLRIGKDRISVGIFKINVKLFYMYLGIDIGGTKTLVAILNNDGVIEERVKFATAKDITNF